MNATTLNKIKAALKYALEQKLIDRDRFMDFASELTDAAMGAYVESENQPGHYSYTEHADVLEELNKMFDSLID